MRSTIRAYQSRMTIPFRGPDITNHRIVMNELLATLGSLIASLGNTQSASVLRERLALAQDKFLVIKQRVEELEKENASLVKERDEAKAQLARQQQEKNFVEARGALFERLPGGTYSKTPRCPECRRTMWCFEQNCFPYECTNDRCGQKTDFLGRELDGVIASLPKE